MSCEGEARKEWDWHLSDHGNVFTLNPPYISQQLGSPHNTHTDTHTFPADGDFIITEEKQAFV